MAEDVGSFGSKRTDFGELSQLHEKLRALAFGHSITLDLTRNSPSAVGLSFPQEGEALPSLGSRAPYLPSARGSETTREAIASSLKSRALVSSSDILLTASTSEAYSFLLLALCDPGDAILVPRPSYPLFDHLAQLASVKTIPYRIAYDGSWHIELSSLANASRIKQDRIRAVIAVSPNNPTGNRLTFAELDALRQLQLPLIVDEVFRPYIHPNTNEGGPRADPLTMASKSKLTVILDGLSKRSCRPDLKLGWMVAKGSLAPQLLQRLEWVSDTFLSVAGPVQAALPAILKQEGIAQAKVRERLADNLRQLGTELVSCPASLLPSEGGWSAILRLPHTRSEEAWWAALAEEGIWLHPGRLYDLPFGSSFVLSLLTPPEELARFLAILKRLMKAS